MRVLLAMASGARGGGAEHVLGLAAALAQSVDVFVLTGTDGPLLHELRSLDIPAGPIELMHSRFDPRAAQRLARAVANTDADVVHWHGTRAGFYGALLRPVLQKPSVYTAHGLAYRKERSRFRRALFIGAEALACRADAVVSVSRMDLEDLARRGLVSETRGFYVPNAVRSDRWGALPSRAAARRSLGVSGFVVGTTSRLVEQKGVDVALRALAGSDATFVVAGEGPLQEELRTLGARLNVDVRWLGRRDDIGTVLRALDVFLLSSRWEGEPIALLEAMTFGLPCVASATAGARELIDGAGWLVPIDDPDALAQAVQAARIGNPVFTEEARRRAGTRSFSAMAERLHHLYDLVVSKKLVDNPAP